MWAYSFNHDVTMMHLEAWWEYRLGHLQMVEAVGTLAYLTVEVGMLVIIVFLTVTVTEFVFRAVAASLDGMYQMMLTEEG